MRPSETVTTDYFALLAGNSFRGEPTTADFSEGYKQFDVAARNPTMGFRPCFNSPAVQPPIQLSLPSIGQTGYIPPPMSMPQVQRQIYLSDRWQPAALAPTSISAYMSGTDIGAIVTDGPQFDRTSPDWTQLGVFFSPIPTIGNYFLIFSGATEDMNPADSYTHGLIPLGWSGNSLPVSKSGSLDPMDSYYRRSRSHSAGRRMYRMGFGPPLYLLSALRAYVSEEDCIGIYSPADDSRSLAGDQFWERAIASGLGKTLPDGAMAIDALEAAESPIVINVPGGKVPVSKAKLVTIQKRLLNAPPAVKRVRGELLARSIHVMNKRVCDYVQGLIRYYGTQGDLDLYLSRPEVRAALNGQRLAGLSRVRLSNLPPLSSQSNRILSGLRFG